MKKLFYLVVAVVVIAGIGRLALEAPQVQDGVLSRFAGLMMSQSGAPEPDSLQVYVCGSSSPLPGGGRAQACIAILTPQHFYIVDSGAGSTRNLTAARLPMQRLQGLFITHFHSDHIAEIPEVNLNSWVAGRPVPLDVYGPKGVRKVVSGLNDTYELDREYRVEHHGEELLAPELGELNAEAIKPGTVLEDGDMVIRAYVADHSPIEPAVGYRFDYRGRSVIVSGDSLVTDQTREISAGADLLLHDALSIPIISTLSNAAAEAGRDRQAKILSDVIDYHASVSSLAELATSTDIDMVALYHLVPVPQNIVMELIYKRELPDNVVITDDGMWFELPVESDEIVIR